MLANVVASWDRARWLESAERLVSERFGDAGPERVVVDGFPLVFFNADGHGLKWLSEASLCGLRPAVVPGPVGNEPFFAYVRVNENDGAAYGVTFDATLAFEYLVVPIWYGLDISARAGASEAFLLPGVMDSVVWRWHKNMGDDVYVRDGAAMVSGECGEGPCVTFFSLRDHGLPISVDSEKTLLDGHGPVMMFRLLNPDENMVTRASFACYHPPSRGYGVYKARWDHRGFDWSDFAMELSNCRGTVAFHLCGEGDDDGYQSCSGIYATEDGVSWHRYL